MIDKGLSIAVLLMLLPVGAVSGQDIAAQQPAQASNILGALSGGVPKPTLGGSQFWGDVHIFHDWRIQQRVGEERFRLLSPKEFCHAEGTFGQCRAKLEQIKLAEGLKPMRGRAVLILHGLVATRWTMRLLADHLRDNGGYTVVNVEYPSTRQPMSEHAKALARVIEGLPEVEQLNFIGHSMGNIVIRHYMADMQKKYGRQDSRLGRVVMIAPPNHGSLTATRWSDNSAFKAVLGRPGRQLGIEWSGLEGNLAVPPCQFGIIAGGRGKSGFSPFLPGDDDGRICVETTKLVGAHDFVIVSNIHEFIGNDPRTFDLTLKFLDEGCFVAANQRNPIRQQPSSQMAGGASGQAPGRTTWQKTTSRAPNEASRR